MKKQDLIYNLTRASDIEDTNTNKISAFLLEEYNWGDIDPEKVEQIKKMLKVIKEQSQEHFETVNRILEEVRGSEKDDF